MCPIVTLYDLERKILQQLQDYDPSSVALVGPLIRNPKIIKLFAPSKKALASNTVPSERVPFTLRSPASSAVMGVRVLQQDVLLDTLVAFPSFPRCSLKPHMTLPVPLVLGRDKNKRPAGLCCS